MRNKRIKTALAKHFGYKNVSVRSGSGTASGWVNIRVTVPPKDGTYWLDKYINETQEKVWKILREENLLDELSVWYDEMGNKRYECIVEVKIGEVRK